MPSKQVLEQKKLKVDELTKRLSEAVCGVLVNYRGINVEDDTKLRSSARARGVNYSIEKNTMLRFAINNTGLTELDSQLEGPTSIATSSDDIIAPAKVMCDFAKENECIEIKAGFIEGKVVDGATIKKIAELPPKEVLIGQVLRGLNSPISGLANVLNANLSGLARVLNAIAQKQSAA
ncbi:MAG: 50S ribosomal protein L10 [Clostridiales bacterium]|nr:50S ribosomal protein L10 [Clostridiales bacterium]